MNNRDGQTTIITGASRGIGAATARRLARAGHDLVLTYRTDEAAADRTLASVTAEGVNAIKIRADVSREEDIDRLFDAATAQFGQVTGLVNNAGVTAHIGDLVDTPTDVIRRVIDVNLTGLVLCSRRAAQVMSLRRGGRGGAIVNVSSSAATLGSAHEYVHYAAAKAAVDTFTLGLGKELADDGIRVNAVAPGVVRTDIHAAAGDPDRPDRVSTRIPLGRPGDVDEIAAAIEWLLSRDASYVTGAVLRVSGGL